MDLTFYEVVDIDSGNVLGDFDTREEVIDALCIVAKRDGLDAIAHCSLMRIDGDRQSVLAMREELQNTVSLELAKRDDASPGSLAKTFATVSANTHGH